MSTFCLGNVYLPPCRDLPPTSLAGFVLLQRATSAVLRRNLSAAPDDVIQLFSLLSSFTRELFVSRTVTADLLVLSVCPLQFALGYT